MNWNGCRSKRSLLSSHLACLLCWVAVVWVLPPGSQAERHFVQLDNVPPTAFFVGSFGFDGEGKLGLRMSNITINGHPPRSDSQRAVGFVVKRSATDRRDFLHHQENTCPLRLELNAFEMRHILPPKEDEFRIMSTIRVDAPGYYSVYFIHCSGNDLISGEIEAAFLNRGSHLAIGEQPMTMVLGALLPLYVGGWYLWMTRAPAAAWSQSQTQRRIRMYVSGVWTVRALFVASDLGRLLWVRSSGWVPSEGYMGFAIYYVGAWLIAALELLVAGYTWRVLQAQLLLTRKQLLGLALQVVLLAPYLCHEALLYYSFPLFDSHVRVVVVLYGVLTWYQLRGMRAPVTKMHVIPPLDKEERGAYRVELLRTLYVCAVLLYLCLTLEDTLTRALYFRLAWVGHLLSEVVQLLCVGVFSYRFIRFQSKSGDSPPRSSSSTLPGEVSLHEPLEEGELM